MNGSAVNPIGGRGYNKNGELIASNNALDARREDINPYAVQAAVSAAIAEAEEQVQNVMLALYRIYGKAGFILNDIDLTEPEDNMEQAIKSIPGYISKNLEELVSDAEKVRNNFQSQYNEAVRTQMRSAQRESRQYEEEYQIETVRFVDIGGSN